MKAFAVHTADEWSRNGPDLADYCSREGAQALKEKIEAFWRARGQDVMLSLHNVGFHPAIRAARFDVRSDMVNGMPRGAGAQPMIGHNAAAMADDLDVLDEDEHWLDP
ncbi:MAG: hypothetical protein ABUL73_03770 [Alphaproteobacteria bacterium]